MIRRVAILAAGVLAACGPGVVAVDETIDATVSHSEGSLALPGSAEGIGEAGPLDAAVIELMLSAPGSPVVAYLDAAMARGDAVIARLRPAAARIAGHAPVTAQHLARAFARRLAPAINRGLMTSGGREYAGVVDVVCCGTVDPASHTFDPAYGGAPLELTIVVSRVAMSARLVWTDGLHQGSHTWDLRHLRRAFDARSGLAFETVAELAIPLHPGSASR